MKLLKFLGAKSAAVQPTLESLYSGECEVFDDGRDRYVSFPKDGVSVMFRDDQLETIFLYTDGLDGFSAYAGEIPFGITLSDSEEKIIAKVERTVASEGTARGLPFPKRRESSWSRFSLPQYALHAEFRDFSRESLRLISLMRRDSARFHEN